MYKVSIIVPVYNCEKHLETCIRSLIGQTYNNIEIIIVDDGSSDTSGSICDELASIDERIIVFHNTNHGVSYSRNFGISKSRGEYLAFVDSDDVMKHDFIEEALNKCVKYNCDYICASFTLLKDNSLCNDIDYIDNEVEFLTAKEYLDRMLDYQAGAYWGANWAKLYKRSIIFSFSIGFEENISFAEDFRFNLHYLEHVVKIGIIHKSCYLYRVDTLHSLSKKSRDTYKYWQEYNELCNRLMRLANTIGFQNNLDERILSFRLNACKSALRNEISQGLSHYRKSIIFLREAYNTVFYKYTDIDMFSPKIKKQYKQLFKSTRYYYVFALWIQSFIRRIKT